MDRSTDLAWRKSSYSGGGSENCVEVAMTSSGNAAVRDSKDPRGPHLEFASHDWKLFLARVASGELG